MGRTFTQYWTKSFWQETGREEGQALSHTASDQFEEMEVDEGDTLYIITLQNGALFLVGRMSVCFSADRAYAASVLAYRPWKLSGHLFASECTAVRFDRRVPAAVASELRFEGPQGEVAIAFDASGNIPENAINGVRRIPSASADLLDRLLEGERTFTADWPDDEEDGEDDEALDSREFAAVSDDGEQGDDDDDEESILDALIAYFEEQAYDYDLDDDGCLLSTFGDEEGDFVVLAAAVGSRVVITVTLPSSVPEERRAAVAETALRANAESIEADLLLNFETGVVTCRSVTFNDDGILEQDEMGDVFEDTLERAMAYQSALQRVIGGTATPKEAVEVAETELEAAAPTA